MKRLKAKLVRMFCWTGNSPVTLREIQDRLVDVKGKWYLKIGWSPGTLNNLVGKDPAFQRTGTINATNGAKGLYALTEATYKKMRWKKGHRRRRRKK